MRNLHAHALLRKTYSLLIIGNSMHKFLLIHLATTSYPHHALTKLFYAISLSCYKKKWIELNFLEGVGKQKGLNKPPQYKHCTWSALNSFLLMRTSLKIAFSPLWSENLMHTHSSSYNKSSEQHRQTRSKRYLLKGEINLSGGRSERDQEKVAIHYLTAISISFLTKL